MNVVDLRSHGIEWKGHEDTQYLKITGTAMSATDTALFDVKLCRVNSSGSFTEVYVKLSRYDE